MSVCDGEPLPGPYGSGCMRTTASDIPGKVVVLIVGHENRTRIDQHLGQGAGHRRDPDRHVRDVRNRMIRCP